MQRERGTCKHFYCWCLTHHYCKYTNNSSSNKENNNNKNNINNNNINNNNLSRWVALQSIMMGWQSHSLSTQSIRYLTINLTINSFHLYTRLLIYFGHACTMCNIIHQFSMKNSPSIFWTHRESIVIFLDFLSNCAFDTSK